MGDALLMSRDTGTWVILNNGSGDIDCRFVEDGPGSELRLAQEVSAMAHRGLQDRDTIKILDGKSTDYQKTG